MTTKDATGQGQGQGPGSIFHHFRAARAHAATILQSLSLYSPMVLCASMLVFGLFAGAVPKVLLYFFWLFVATFARVLVGRGLHPSASAGTGPNTNNRGGLPAVCSTGVTELFVPADTTYSLYLLAFTLVYLVLPMVMQSVQLGASTVNYGVLAFFVGYMVLDVSVKRSLACLPAGRWMSAVGSDVLGGAAVGALVGGLAMYGSPLKPYLFLNDLNPDREVCSMPTKQQFKCKVYKNGALVGDV